MNSKESILFRLSIVEKRWAHAREEVIYTRDWRVETHLRFLMIDLKEEHKRLKHQLLTLSQSPTV